MGSSNDAKIFQSLKKIVDGPYGDERRLELLADVEIQHKTGLSILSYLIKMVPLTTTLVCLQRLMLLFSRKVIQLLDEMKILKNSETAKETLQLVNNFWSLCSNQQAVVIPFRTCSRWEPDLIEIVTSLASVYIDLFIVAHKNTEKKTVWSKRLYSWLTFDLTQRAMKTALLEVSCPVKKANKLLSPILRKILSSPLVFKSNMDYLLHMLLVKKWADVCDDEETEIVQLSRNLKAPKKFISWLAEKWSEGHEYIPQDKSLKGRRVSQFLVDLDGDVLESLTDVYCDCLNGKEDAADTPEAGLSVESEEQSGASFFTLDKKGSSDFIEDVEMIVDGVSGDENEPGPSSAVEDLFVLDKKGADIPVQVSDSEEEVQYIKEKNKGMPKRQKRKHDDSVEMSPVPQDSDCFISPRGKIRSDSAPTMKKRKTNHRNKDNSITHLAVDGENNSQAEKYFEVSSNGSDDIEILNAEDDASNGIDDDDDNPLGLDDSDFEALTEMEGNEEIASTYETKSRVENTLRQNPDVNSILGSDDDDDVLADDEGIVSDAEVIITESQTIKACKKNVKGNEGKPAAISDPVSTYFAPQKESKKVNIRVFDLTEESEESGIVGVEKIVTSSKKPSSPRKTQKSDKVCTGTETLKNDLSPITPSRSKRRCVLDGDEQPVPTSSERKKSEFTSIKSPLKLSKGEQKDASNKRSPAKASPNTSIIVHEDGSEEEITFKIDTNINSGRKPTMEEEISRQLTDIRKSVPKKTVAQVEMASVVTPSPTRVSSRLRTKLGSEKLTPSPRGTRRQILTQKMVRENQGSATILQDWLRSPSSNKSQGEIMKSPVSPSKIAKKNSETEEMDINGLSEMPEISNGLPQKRQKVKSPVKEQATQPPKTPSQGSPTKGKKSLTKEDIFPPTYSRSTQKSLFKDILRPASEKTTSPSNSNVSASIDQDILYSADSYNLRTPKKSDSVQSNEQKRTSKIDSPISTPSEKSQVSANAKSKANNKEKMTKLDTDVKASTQTPPKATTHASKTPRSASNTPKVTPKTSVTPKTQKATPKISTTTTVTPKTTPNATPKTDSRTLKTPKTPKSDTVTFKTSTAPKTESVTPKTVTALRSPNVTPRTPKSSTVTPKTSSSTSTTPNGSAKASQSPSKSSPKKSPAKRRLRSANKTSKEKDAL